MRKALILLPLLALLLNACKYEVPVLPGSGGKTCEIIVITPKEQWEGPVGDTLRHWFMRVQPGLNQPEPYFNLVNIVPKAFNESEMFQHHRNVFIVEFDTAAAPKVEVIQDLWAFPQVVIKFTAPDRQTFYELFAPRKEALMQAIYAKEYQRIQRAFKGVEEIEVLEKLRRWYGFEMIFPDGFTFASSRSDFAWIRKESKDYGQGIIFSIYPYTGLDVFDPENIIAQRNRMCQNVPGPAEGSYMTTETRFPEYAPFCKTINLDGMYAVETRGLWRLEGDFMGGPFVNYVFVDTANQRTIMLDAYLYSPRKPKRDLLVQMESVARSFKFYTPPVATDSIANLATDKTDKPASEDK